MTPTCPEQCSGGHSVDSHILCPRCGGVGYRVINHEWPGQVGHYWVTLEPVNGRPELAPREQPMCRDCGVAMVRR